MGTTPTPKEIHTISLYTKETIGDGERPGLESTQHAFLPAFERENTDTQVDKGASEFLLDSIQVCLVFLFPETVTHPTYGIFHVKTTEVLGQFQNSWTTIT